MSEEVQRRAIRDARLECRLRKESAKVTGGKLGATSGKILVYKVQLDMQLNVH